ncbi:MAG: EAL domain-containing protein [Gammaproteobacteria bacterium]|nr:MAG: EAL domain-containing protein [Gammaproteobacteria bacterium]
MRICSVTWIRVCQLFTATAVINLAAYALLSHTLLLQADTITLTAWHQGASGLLGLSVAGWLGALTLQNIRLRNRLACSHGSQAEMIQLAQALTQSGTSVMIVDGEGVIHYVNPHFCKTSGYSESDAIGRPIGLLNPRSERLQFDHLPLRWDTRVLQAGWTGEILCEAKDGHTFWSSVTVSSMDEENGQRFVISAVDITELKVANASMQAMALYDALTGLANRRLFSDRLEQSLRAASRDHTRVALLFLDLDQFKRINDTLGHDAGDQLLKTIAERLKGCVREKDTVARLGGDEFVILLTDVHEDNAVRVVARHVLTELKRPMQINNHELRVSTSIGITLAPDDGNDVEKLMKNADLALYKAKANGRDGYQFFTDDLNRKAQRQMTIERQLRTALEHEEFSLTYQPQFDLASGHICRVEALLRWHHPERGLVSPGEFLDVAEETGQITEIGGWVLKQACTQIRLLHQITGKSLQVAINLSHRQFHDPNLVESVMLALQASGLPAQSLVLEITEGMLIQDAEYAIRVISQLKRYGVTLSIDDFGSGYSSLSYLRDLPVDMLKIDQSFIRDIPEQLADMEVTAAIIALAQRLSLKVVAEGVENEDQHDFLIINKCDYAQGFYYSPPLVYEQLYRYVSDAPVTVPE